MIVNKGSSANVLFNHAYKKMGPKLLKKLKPYDHDLFEFNGQSKKARGIIYLPFELGDGKHVATHKLDSDSSYIAILGQLTLSIFRGRST